MASDIQITYELAQECVRKGALIARLQQQLHNKNRRIRKQKDRLKELNARLKAHDVDWAFREPATAVVARLQAGDVTTVPLNYTTRHGGCGHLSPGQHVCGLVDGHGGRHVGRDDGALVWWDRE